MCVESLSHECSKNLSALSLSADMSRKNIDVYNFEEVDDVHHQKQDVYMTSI